MPDGRTGVEIGTNPERAGESAWEMGTAVLPHELPAPVDDSDVVVAVQTVDRVQLGEKAAQAVLQEGGGVENCEHDRGSGFTRPRSIEPKPDEMRPGTPSRLSQVFDLSSRRRNASSGLR